MAAMSDRILTTRFGLSLLLVGLVTLPCCQTVQTTQAGAVGVERKQTMMRSVCGRK